MSLPVTRTFSGVTGAIPTADETAWAYNRTGTSDFTVVTTGGGFIEASDRTVDTAQHWTGDTFGADHYSEIVLATCTTAVLGNGYGPAVRMDTGSTNKTYYRLVCSTAGWELFKFNNGVNASLASSASPTFTTGDTVRLSISGSTFTMTKNGTAFGSPPTDSTLTTGASGVAHSSTTTLHDGIDSWTGGNVGATAAQLIPAFTQTGGTWGQVYV